MTLSTLTSSCLCICKMAEGESGSSLVVLRKGNLMQNTRSTRSRQYKCLLPITEIFKILPISQVRICNCSYAQCNPYDAGYVGYTCSFLHELVDGYKQKSSTTWKHYFGEHNSNEPPCLSDQFQAIIKCSNKFDCLIKATCLRRKLNHP